ncbi:ataxin-1 [Trichomycterus rosablanca]|uniref:ataxin-1 n=1 Tax=Trichomycterus rosablanca TaxID=2290929 RepID=UPI002F356582
MKSHQERSNECLPPKKREILALEERQVLVASTMNESQSGENLAWLASVASMASMATVTNHVPSKNNNIEADSPQPPSAKAQTIVTEYLPSTSAFNSNLSSYSSSTPKGGLSGATTITANPAVLSSNHPQSTASIQPSQLPNLQIIGPYTSYISSQIVPTAASPTQSCGPTQEVYATTAVIPQASNGNPQKQHVISALPNVAQTTSQCIQVEGTHIGLPVISPTSQIPLQLHPHSAVLASHGLTLAPSQVLVHYADGLITKQPDSQSRDLQNGALEEVTVVKHSTNMVKGVSNKPESDISQRYNQNLGLQTQAQVLISADYATHDSVGLQTSVMLVSSNHLVASNTTELQNPLNKDQTSLAHTERTGLSVSKPIPRVPTLTLSSSENLAASSLASNLSPHTVLHTSPPAAMQELSTSLFSTTQLPIIGYITSTSGESQQAVASYHSNLPQHLIISGSPSLLIPVSAGNINTSSSSETVVTRCSIPTISPANIQTVATGLSQAFISTATPAITTSVISNGKEVIGPEVQPPTTVVQNSTQMQLPVLSSGVVASPARPAPVLTPTLTSPQNAPLSPSSPLPPYFMKGSIIQLADGELKRVEDLRTEDFLQSAEVSKELKIDSSTVERIDSSRTPDAVIIQFSVGEQKAQVCVEVVVEYPFFVFGQGWSSCCPDRTTQLLALSCAKLSVGDVCISLTLKSLRNGALRKDQTFEPVKNNNYTDLKAPKTNGQVGERSAQRGNQRDGNIVRLGGKQKSDSPESFTFSKSVIISMDGEKKSQSVMNRKRRWSAPEKGDIGKSKEGELPVVLPKLSFLSQEVKVSIEGRSSMGTCGPSGGYNVST